MAAGSFLYTAAGVAGTVATWLSRIVPESENKIVRSVRARRGLVERFEAWTGRDMSRPLLWMHAPSVGEGLQARPVLERLRALRPDVQLVYSHFSPSAARFAKSLDVDFADYLPFDTTRNAERVFRALRPDAFVCAKLDLWPHFARAAANNGVKLGMISATLSGRSSRQGFVASRLLHPAYALLDRVGAISDDDSRRLIALGVNPRSVAVTGDTRFDQVWARAQRAKEAAHPYAAIASNAPLFVAGSTWPADETVLLSSWLEIRGRVHARLLIAPHEPTEAHLRPIEQWAAGNGISIARLDAPEAASAEVVLVDRVGVLGDLYALGRAAFVGGGFHSAGLHSVLEPAAFGLPVAFGPRHGNAREAAELMAKGGATEVRSSKDLSELLRIWFAVPSEYVVAGEAARNYVRDGLGAADRATRLVLDLLPNPE